MTKKLSKEVFFTNFRDVIHDGLLELGFQLVTDELLEKIIASNSRYKNRPTPKFNCHPGSDSTYIRPYADEVFGHIYFDIRPKPDFKKGLYICLLSQGIVHAPTQFLLAELQSTTFRPLDPLDTWGAIRSGNEDVLGYDSNLPASELRSLASRLLTAVETEAIPWMNKESNLASLEHYFDQVRHPSLGKVCFYIAINRNLKARAEMNCVTQEFAFRLKRSLSRGFTGYSEEEEQSRRCRNLWIDNQVIEQVNQLTFDEDK
jgi:hypothetical protein